MDVGNVSQFDNQSLWEQAEQEIGKEKDFVSKKKIFGKTKDGKTITNKSTEPILIQQQQQEQQEQILLPQSLPNYLNNKQGIIRSGSKLKAPVLSKSSSILKRMMQDKAEYSWKTFNKIGIGSTIPPENMPQWQIYETRNHICEYLWEYFCGLKNVKVFNKSFTRITNNSTSMTTTINSSPSSMVVSDKVDFEAVLLCGNVYGFREDEIMWNDCEQYFGGSVIDSIRKYIIEHYLGEAPLYSSFILETGHPIVKYLVYCCSSFAEQHSDPYEEMWSSFLAIRKHNLKARETNETLISRFASEAFCRANDGEEESVRKMYIAYHNFMAPPVEVSPSYFPAKVDTLKSMERIHPDERQAFIVDQLLKGELEKRNFISLGILELLMDIYVGNISFGDVCDKEKLQKIAIKTSCYYAWPNEYINEIQEIILRKTAIQPILELSLSGDIQTHKEIDPAEIEFEELLAEGSSGKVYKGKWKGLEVALKKFEDDMLSFSMIEFRREVAIMSILKHPNLVLFYGACTKTKSSLIIITKFIKKGSLRNLLMDKSFEIPFNFKLKICIEIAQGMAFLHSKDIIHRDLKSLNVLVDEENSMKITDFGTSRIVERATLMTSAIGTVSWMAPEILNNEKYSEKADVYSFGIIIWEILSRKIPFEELPSWNIPVAVTKGERPTITKEMNPELVKIMKICWHQKPSKRPSFVEILQELNKLQAQTEYSTL